MRLKGRRVGLGIGTGWVGRYSALFVEKGRMGGGDCLGGGIGEGLICGRNIIEFTGVWMRLVRLAISWNTMVELVKLDRGEWFIDVLDLCRLLGCWFGEPWSNGDVICMCIGFWWG